MRENDRTDRANRPTVSLPQESVHFKAGTVIGGYTIDSLLRVGSQATLFNVSKNGAKSVMRVSFIDEEPDSELINKLGTEKSAHLPLIISGTHQEHFFEILPRYEPLPSNMKDSEKQAFMKQAEQALKALHALGYVHNDIKPEHFMRKADGTVVLIDFGNASKIGTAPKHISAFLAKEACSKPVAGSDYFSLGCALIELFTPAFRGKGRKEILEMTSNPAHIQPFLKDLPKDIRDRILQMLSDDPLARTEKPAARRSNPAARASAGQPAARSENSSPPANHSESVKALKESIAAELYDLILKADPALFVRAQNAFAGVNAKNAGALSGYLDVIRRYPRSARVVNYTNISKKQVLSMLKRPVATKRGDLSKTDPIRSLRKMHKKGLPYIFNKDLIDEWDRQGAEINNKRNERDWQILKVIGIVVGTIAAVAAAIAILVAIVVALFYIIVAVVVICAIGAALSG